jgi:hypothetical protein
MMSVTTENQIVARDVHHNTHQGQEVPHIRNSSLHANLNDQPLQRSIVTNAIHHRLQQAQNMWQHIFSREQQSDLSESRRFSLGELSSALAAEFLLLS